MGFDKLKKLIGNNDSDIEEVKEEEYYKVSREEYTDENGVAGSKMMLLEPRAYSESQQIADYLKERNAVVVNLKRVTPDQAKRIVDFLSGTLYAIGGDLQKLEGQISDDAAPTKQAKRTKKQEDDEFDW